jgi:hypothetical protein
MDLSYPEIKQRIRELEEEIENCVVAEYCDSLQHELAMMQSALDAIEISPELTEYDELGAV